MQTILAYINSKKYAWSPTTLKSEGARLNSVLDLLDLSPIELYERLQSRGYKPYTIKTMLTRVAEYKQFCGDESFKVFIKEHARLFKSVYIKKRVGVTFEEASQKIESIKDSNIREVCRLMLQSGLRVHEALKYDGSGYVIGKGNRRRPVFGKFTITSRNVISYSSTYRALLAVGLNPHALRKLAATRMANRGFKTADLLEVMGWSNIQTAASYLQPDQEALLGIRVQEALRV